MRNYVALLRAIAHVPMRPFREALEELGFTDVASYGMSGNLMFNVRGSRIPTLERRISKRLSAVTMVRTRSEIESVVASDPFHGQHGAATMFLAGTPNDARMAELGRRTSIDLERVLGVAGTARSSSVVSEILKRMSE